MNGKVKVLLVVASLFCITSPALASASCQTKNDLKVCFYEKYTGISHHAWNISVEDLDGPPPDSINISTLIDSTNFPASKIHNAKLYSYENITYTEEVFDHYKYVNGTLHDNGTVEDYNATHLNYTVNSNSTFVRKHRSPGAYDWSAADNWWTENESRAVYRNEEKWEWRWQRAKEQYFKRNAERFTQGMGTFAVPPNPKWFRYEFDTPVRFWSKGRFALNVNDVQFDPWWSTTYKFKRELLNASNDLVLPFVDENPDGDGSLSTYYGQGNGDIYYNNDGDFAFANDTDQRCGFSTIIDGAKGRVDETVNCPADLITYYPFDNNGTKYDAWDPISGNNGTLEGGVGALAAGKVKKGVEFHGDSDDDIATGITTLNSDQSWAVWMKHAATPLAGSAIVKACDSTNNWLHNIRFWGGNGSVAWERQHEGWVLDFRILTSTALNDSTWHLLVGTWNYTSGEAKFYLDGNLVGTDTGTGDVTEGNQIYVGRNVERAQNAINGNVDNLMIWHRVLSASEVSALYNATKPVVGHDPRFGAEETSPIIKRVSVPDVHKNEDFLVRVKSFCVAAHCGFKDYNLSLELPTGFSIPDDKENHPNPEIDENRTWVTTWEVKAPDMTGTYLLNVSGPVNKVTNNITVKRNIFDIEDAMKSNLTEEHTDTRNIIKKNITEEHGTTKSIIKENLTKELQNRWQKLNATYLKSNIRKNITQELQNRWQNLNASYLNGTAIERVRKLADYLNQTRWGTYIASDLYDVANDAKTIANYINQSRWLDKTASDLYDISDQANSTAERARKIAEYVNESRWLDKTASDLYDMADQANDTAELAREIADYINRSRWIDKTAPDIYDMAREANDTAELARNLAEYINESRWTEDNATVLYDIADQANHTAELARKIADYINQSRWQTFKLSTKDSFELGWDGWVWNPVGLPTGTAATRTTDWASHKNWSVNLGDIANKMMNTSRDLTMIEKIVFDWRITDSDQRIQFHIDGKEKASITGTPAPRTETEVIDVSDLVGVHELTFYGETTVSGAPCYTDNIRFIPFFYEDISEFSKKARDLADYINGTRWGKYVAEDLRNMSDKARKIAQYINETRWKGFVAKDIFAEAESARKEAERTYEEMHDLKRVLIKEMRKTVLRALGIKGPPSSHSSSSSSPGGSSSVPSSSPKTLPTGKATRTKSRGIVGGVVHFFARGVRGLSLIAQSVIGG